MEMLLIHIEFGDVMHCRIALWSFCFALPALHAVEVDYS